MNDKVVCNTGPLIALAKTDRLAGQGVKRHPHVDIAGKMKLLGDVMSSAPETDWDLPAYGGNAGD